MKMSQAHRLLRSRSSKNSRRDQWLEILFLSVLPIAVGFQFNPADPFFIRAEFPVLILAPFILALRYGKTGALASFLIIASCITLASLQQWGNIQSFPGLLLFGLLVVALTTGEYITSLTDEIERSNAENQFLTMRFGEFTNAYHVIKISHDQLKEEVANTRFSLREAFTAVRNSLQKQHKKGNRGLSKEIGSELLSILSYFCSIQIAAVYNIDTTGRISPVPVAEQGNARPLDTDDQLIAKAMEEGTLVSIRPDNFSDKSEQKFESDLLAVIPVKDISGYIWGLVIVSEMYFTAYQDENLNLMQLLGSYTGDLLSHADNIFYKEDDREKFIAELESCWRLASEFRIPSSIINITFREKVPEEKFLQALIDRTRGLDKVWLYRDAKQRPVICILLPLMEESEYIHYQKSLNMYLHEHSGQTMEEAGGAFAYLEISGKRRLYDYVGFISKTVDTDFRGLPELTQKPFSPAEDSVTDLLEEFGEIELKDNRTGVEQVSIPRNYLLPPKTTSRRPAAEKLGPAELQWLYRALTRSTPDKLRLKGNLWTRDAVCDLVQEKFRIQTTPLVAGKLLATMGIKAKNVLFSAIVDNPNIVLDWQVNVLPSIISQARKAEALLFFIDTYPVEDIFLPALAKLNLPVHAHEKNRQQILYSAVHNLGDHYFMVSEHAVDPGIMCAFLENLAEQMRKPLFLVADNSPMYQHPEMVNLIENYAGDIKLFYLPSAGGKA